MPVTLNPASGELDADVIDGNFAELESFLREGVTEKDFGAKFTKYNIRRHTGGRITSFNAGVSRLPSPDMSNRVGTFENNWISGAPEVRFVDYGGKSLRNAVTKTYEAWPDTRSLYNTKTDMSVRDDHLYHPFELLGFPGGSLYYDFQEQGFSDPVSFYAEKEPSLTIDGWPPEDSLTVKFPDNECWSRWLTVPDCAGSVYVDEPCVAIVTAQVTGNYFFTPAMRVHGQNTRTVVGVASGTAEDPEAKQVMVNDGAVGSIAVDGDAGVVLTIDGDDSPPVKSAARIVEGFQKSASIRLGLFVDTNPIVWEDEFKNEGADDSGYNPWIGTSATGVYSAERADGVAKYRSWKKITDLSLNVRQRSTYKVIGAVELKGRRKYNFSLKFRPAMTLGHVQYSAPGSAKFLTGYYELSEGAAHMPTRGEKNVAWDWASIDGKSVEDSYFYPGGDALVTNLIESSAMSVEFFYGQKLADVIEGIEANTDPQNTGQ